MIMIILSISSISISPPEEGLNRGKRRAAASQRCRHSSLLYFPFFAPNFYFHFLLNLHFHFLFLFFYIFFLFLQLPVPDPDMLLIVYCDPELRLATVKEILRL